MRSYTPDGGAAHTLTTASKNTKAQRQKKTAEAKNYLIRDPGERPAEKQSINGYSA